MDITDQSGRVVIAISDDGSVAMTRYPDLSEKGKKWIAKMYADLTGETFENSMSFLNYDSEEEFCS